MEMGQDDISRRTASGREQHSSRRAGRIDILGIPVDNLSRAEAVATIQGWVAEAEAHADAPLDSDAESPVRLHHVVTVNPEFIVEARHNRLFRSALRAADLSTADGVGVVLAARLLGRRLRGRITGVDLVEGIAEAAGSDSAIRLFLLGAGEGIAARAAAELKQRYPGCVIAGSWSGSPSEVDFAVIQQQLAASRPNLLLVAFGHPKQDIWIARHQSELAAYGIVVAMGIGGALDYLAGAVPRAPALIRRVGLEWLFRLIRQPWRWRRQLALPRFVMFVLRERLKSDA